MAVRKIKPAKDVNMNGDTADDHHKMYTAEERKHPLWNLVEKVASEGFPLCAMTVFPTAILLLIVSCNNYDGSVVSLGQAMLSKGVGRFAWDVWASAGVGDPLALSLIGGFVLVQLVLTIIVPGPVVYGPATKTGHIPKYTDNGFSIYIIDLVLFALVSLYLKTSTSISPSIVYDNFLAIEANLTVIGLIVCLVLYIKGRVAPSKGEHGSTSHFLFDYYWGLELYPRIFGIDVKVFTNCRFGCTLWAILPCCFAFKSYELHGFVDSMFVYLFLLLVYLTKFFWWEGGYMNTLDIILDRAGFYICWGCICFVPGVYAILGYYLVSHPNQWGATLSAGLLLLGVVSTLINYAADWERQYVRKHNGKCTVWGKAPELIQAKYTTPEGKEKESLLLASGFWGISRHFHYVPELFLALAWSLTAGFTHFLPYLYVVILFFLLVHRSYRDDSKCLAKYGKYWLMYRRKVPYKILPYVL